MKVTVNNKDGPSVVYKNFNWADTKMPKDIKIKVAIIFLMMPLFIVISFLTILCATIIRIIASIFEAIFSWK